MTCSLWSLVCVLFGFWDWTSLHCEMTLKAQCLSLKSYYLPTHPYTFQPQWSLSVPCPCTNWCKKGGYFKGLSMCTIVCKILKRKVSYLNLPGGNVWLLRFEMLYSVPPIFPYLPTVAEHWNCYIRRTGCNSCYTCRRFINVLSNTVILVNPSEFLWPLHEHN